MKTAEVIAEKAYHRKDEFLQQKGWTYKGCGYWIDPLSTLKYMTETAFAIQKQRDASK